ncbi:hypothetical protein NQ317_018317 [Molorchus minor]|uniref:Reverse transcriptase domain-containing protein n=1 Tax=Molorchus minor TaxID=1323400 RepID=A0ABQ9J1G7_9CUCU|nr:hypothetical protein NQ317_018317 [Molorchus minor]
MEDSLSHLYLERKAAGIPVRFRPNVLSMVGKQLERVIKERIEQELEEKGGLSEKQFGFRKGHSTIQAIDKIVGDARKCEKKWLALIAVDVENAFNSATWSIIIRELHGRGISKYLKTEAIILKGKRKREHLNFNLQGTRIIPRKHITYLGVVIDEKITFTEHIKHTSKKADSKIAALTRILPNIGGPSSLKREVLCGVIHSIIRYGAPVWYEVLEKRKYRNILSGVQRKALLRIASGYRTISTNALQVIVGIPPISLLAEERQRLFRIENSHLQATKQRERDKTLAKWQQGWESNTENAAWTRTLIKDLRKWIRCEHRNLDFFLTQFLSGHGAFRAYLKKMGLTEDEKCIYCGMQDTAEHAILTCDRWEIWRNELETVVGEKVDRNNVIETMQRNKEYWEKTRTFVGRVMQQKKGGNRVDRKWSGAMGKTRINTAMLLR